LVLSKCHPKIITNTEQKQAFFHENKKARNSTLSSL
jgi:hypothetical protein